MLLALQDNYATCIRSMDKFDPAVACAGSGLFTPARYTSFTFVTGQGTNNQPVLPQAVTVVQMLYEDPVTGSLTPVNANSTIASYNATTRMCRCVHACDVVLMLCS